MQSQNEHTTYVSALVGNRADMALIIIAIFIIIFVVVGLGSGCSPYITVHWQHYSLHWEISFALHTSMNLVNHVRCTV